MNHLNQMDIIMQKVLNLSNEIDILVEQTMKDEFKKYDKYFVD